MRDAYLLAVILEHLSSSTSELWATGTWRADAVRWIDAALQDAGLTRVGDVERPRIRPWSTELVVETDAGRTWFKENCPGQAFEAGLVAALSRLVPDHVVAPLAVDTARGWMLTPDHGPTLQALGHTDPVTWERVMTDYADAQRRCSRHDAELAAAGLPAMRPQDVAAWAELRTADLAAMPAGDPRRIDADGVARIRAYASDLQRWCDLLAASPVPLSLEHNDLHDNNTFVPQASETRLRFFDFGDSVWAHPFSSLLVPFNVLGRQLQATPSDPRMGRVFDAYLEVWDDLADRSQLRELARAAMHVGRVNRAASWWRCLPSLNASELAEFGHLTGMWLTLVADDPPV